MKFIGHSAIVVGHSLHSIAGTLGELLRRACSHLACLGVGVVEVIGGGFHDVGGRALLIMSRPRWARSARACLIASILVAILWFCKSLDASRFMVADCIEEVS